MSNNTSAKQLKDWFGYLKSFKTCAEQINTDVVALSLLDFANAKTATYLQDTVDQNQFAVSAQAATNIAMQAADVAAASTFLSLLGSTFGPSNVYIAAYLRNLAPATLQADGIGTFMQQKNAAVFPKGSTDPLWVQMNAGISGIIDASCYSSTQQNSIAVIVSSSAKQITDIVNQIAKLR